MTRPICRFIFSPSVSQGRVTEVAGKPPASYIQEKYLLKYRPWELASRLSVKYHAVSGISSPWFVGMIHLEYVPWKFPSPKDLNSD